MSPGRVSFASPHSSTSATSAGTETTEGRRQPSPRAAHAHEREDAALLLRPDKPRPPRAPRRQQTHFASDMTMLEEQAARAELTPRHPLLLPSQLRQLSDTLRPLKRMALNAGGALAAGGIGALTRSARPAAIGAASSPWAPTGVLAAMGGSGGWPALACMGVLGLGAVFGAGYGASHDAANLGTEAVRVAAAVWPGVAFGLTLFASRALAASCPFPIACVGLLAAGTCIAYGALWLDPARKPRPSEVVATGIYGSIAISLAFGLGGGLAPDLALAQAALTGVCSTILGVATLMGFSLGSREVPTFFVDDLRVRASALEEYCFAPGLARPSASGKPLPQTIFQMPEGVEAFVRECQAALGPPGEPFRGFDGLPVLHLYGPPGGGKTMGSRGIAQALGAEYVYLANDDLKTDAIEGVPVGGFNAWSALLQSEQLGRRLQKPVVLMLDEINHILPSLSAPYSEKKFYEAVGFVQLVQTMRLQAQTKCHVVLVTATNFIEEIEKFSRIMSIRRAEFVDKPSASSQRDILIAGQQNIERRLESIGAGPLPVDEEALAALLQAAEARGGISGRSLGKLLEWGKIRLYHSVVRGDASAKTPQQRVQLVFAGMHEALARMPVASGSTSKRSRQPKKHPARPSPSGAAGAEPTASASPQRDKRASSSKAARPSRSDARRSISVGNAAMRAREAEEVLQRCHLRDIPATQVLEELIRSLTAAYLDPANNLALARLKARLGVTSLLYAQLYARALMGERPEHPFRDVLDASALHLFASTEGPGATLQMANAFQASLTLNARAVWRGANGLLQASGIDLEAPLDGLRGGFSQVAAAASQRLRR